MKKYRMIMKISKYKSYINKGLCFILVFSIAMLLFGCGVKNVSAPEIPSLDFEKTEPYVLDLTPIENLKPDPLKPVFLDENMNQIDDPYKASYVLLTPNEYSKISVIIKMGVAYKNVVKEQEQLVNIKIDIINALKEHIELQRKIANSYRELWINSENSYRQEKHDHKVDNAINKVTYLGTVGGFLVFLLLAL